MDERDDKDFPTQGHFIKLSQVCKFLATREQAP